MYFESKQKAFDIIKDKVFEGFQQIDFTIDVFDFHIEITGCESKIEINKFTVQMKYFE